MGDSNNTSIGWPYLFCLGLVKVELEDSCMAILSHNMSHGQINPSPCKIQTDKDTDGCQRGEHFFNFFDLEYQPGSSAVDFYNQYRNLFVASLKKKGDIVKWQNNLVLSDDEHLSPTVEDLILANTLELIDIRLPLLVSEHYQHLIGKTNSLMDHKNDILTKMPLFLKQLEGHCNATLKEELYKTER